MDWVAIAGEWKELLRYYVFLRLLLLRNYNDLNRLLVVFLLRDANLVAPCLAQRPTEVYSETSHHLLFDGKASAFRHGDLLVLLPQKIGSVVQVRSGDSFKDFHFCVSEGNTLCLA